MSGSYSIEGHKAKTRLEDEDTLAFSQADFKSLEEATAKAKEFLTNDQDLGLAVIYREEPDGSLAGVKFIYRDEEGTLEEQALYWGSCDGCCEG